MNNAKLWLVVNPTVGIPIFLGAVAVGSFAVHVAVLSNTTWVSDFLSGEPMGSGMSAAATLPAPATGTGDASNQLALPAMMDGQEALIVLPDGRTAKIVLQPTEEAKATPISHSTVLLE